MTFSIESLLIGVSLLLLVSAVASKASHRLGVPALLLFLGIGMLAGSDGPGGIYFDNAWVAQSLGVVALICILFAGGLDTQWTEVRPVFREGVALSTASVLLTAFLVGLFAVPVLGFSLREGLLLGAIISSTDAAAVFSILRSKRVTLKNHLRPLLELESGSNDPMAVFLTVGLIHLLKNPTAPFLALIPSFVPQLVLGALLGYGFGKVAVFLVNRLRLEYEGLYPVVTLSLAVLAYAATSFVGGSGFLAVYVAGLLMGNDNFAHKRSLLRFHDGLAWLMQITMFLTLGLLVFPSHLPPVIGIGLLVSAFLMLVARPASVFLTLAFSRLGIREKGLVSWVGLRGAVPIILATFPLLAGLPKAEMIFNLVFFIVLTSALIQGSTIPWVAKLLQVASPLAPQRHSPLELENTAGINAELVEFIIPYDAAAAGRPLMELELPRDSLITLICRDDTFLVPSGSTVLEGGDVVQVLVNQHNLPSVRGVLSKQKEAGLP